MYKKSKDYEKLWRLTNQGEVIAGWAKNRHGVSCIVEVRRNGYIGCVGFSCSLYAEDFDTFDINCKSCQLEYIEPHE